jgi:hypothetical protein
LINGPADGTEGAQEEIVETTFSKFSMLAIVSIREAIPGLEAEG